MKTPAALAATSACPPLFIAVLCLPLGEERPGLWIVANMRIDRHLRGGRSFMRHCFLLLLGIALCQTASGEDISREYRIKAAYLYNLSKFITWPDEETLSKDTPITLCVFGYNPFDNYLDKLREHPVRGRTISIRYLDEKQPVDGCQLLFISQHNASAPKLLTLPPPFPPILTVSDNQDFLSRGGMVALISINNNVQLDINLTRAKQAGLTFSANLLEVAHRIQ